MAGNATRLALTINPSGWKLLSPLQTKRGTYPANVFIFQLNKTKCNNRENSSARSGRTVALTIKFISNMRKFAMDCVNC